MDVFFCSDPVQRRRVDALYADEYGAAKAVFGACHLIDFEGVQIDGEPFAEVRMPPVQEPPVEALYRGWMLTPVQYEQLYDTLKAHGYLLVNSPEHYRHCHYLPESYPIIEDLTPESVWIEGTVFSDKDVVEAVSAFGDAPVIVKDYVKSQKHYWDEACFIPNAAHEDRVRQVVRRFSELQGEELEGGLVFRRYVEFETLPTSAEGAAPSVLEYRIFYFDGRLVSMTPYWEQAKYPAEAEVPVAQFTEVASQIRSRFFSMDVSRTTAGDWMIVEIGDGQVSGLPERVDAQEFFTTLHASW